MATYTIEPERKNLHGHYSRDLVPVLEIEPGDSVVFRTLDSGWGLVEQPDPFARPRKFEPRDRATDAGHALCGPVAVRGARPGMALEVAIKRIRPGRWGWSAAGGYPSALNSRLRLDEGPEQVFRWEIDPDRGTARNQHGSSIAIRPFMGNLGMPPGEPGRHSTFPPRPCGGNIDCKELVAGSRLFLSVSVPGALFSVGDGHAVQGGGEVAGPALECPMESVELQFRLHDGPSLTMPRAHTPVGWLAFGFDEDLDEACAIALDGMLDLMGEEFGLDRKEAFALAGLVVDLHVTQVVNQTKGVHAVLPHGALEGLRSR